MNDRKLVHNFKSYISTDNSSFQPDKNDVEELKPKLLPGEIIIGVAHNVLLFAPVTEKQDSKIGSLFVTNYKLSFVTDDQSFGGCRQQNLLLGPYDVTLSMISSIYELSGTENEDSRSKWRKRLLRPAHPVPKRIQGLQILCKNMRILLFGFKFSIHGKGRMIATSLLHHSFPKRHDLLFAYEYKEPYYPTIGDVNMFQRYNDWKREMERTNCQNWRISRANGTADGFYQGAGETLVVPAKVLDHQLSDAARHFRKGRLPIWVWSAPGGAALTRSGEVYSCSNNSGSSGNPAHAHESVLFEAVRRSHPIQAALNVIQLTTPLLQTAYKRLMSICTPSTLTNFWEQDGQFFSNLENSRWIRYVSDSLKIASEAATSLAANISVVLQEKDGMDYCAVISSLTQIILDSHFRTIKGFQSLIQKEWIALGHPFSDRLGHIALDESDIIDGDRDISPVFLLFLDCVWQLQKQFPSSFEFTECYLTTLWDSAHNQLFDTFLFNSPREREIALSKCLNLRPVWDWKEQFIDEEIQYFYNPLYTEPVNSTHRPKSVIPPSAIRLPGLASPQKNLLSESKWLTPGPIHILPKTTMEILDIWKQCYFRWIPLLHIQGSGDIQFLLINIRLAKEIQLLQEKITTASSNKQSNGAKEDSLVNTNCPQPNIVGAFFPFIGTTTNIGDPLALLTTSLLEPHQQLDSQSILNAPD